MRGEEIGRHVYFCLSVLNTACKTPLRVSYAFDDTINDGFAGEMFMGSRYDTLHIQPSLYTEDLPRRLYLPIDNGAKIIDPDANIW